MRSACDLCRIRKIRCDRAIPACETCQLAGLPCVFTPQSGQNRKGLRQELADSQARVQQLEEALAAAQGHAHLTPGGNDSSKTTSLGSVISPASQQSLATQDPATLGLVPDTHCLDTALASFRWHIAYCGLGSPLSTTRSAFYSNIYQRTNYTFDLDDFLDELTQPLLTQGLKGTRRSTSLKWPPTSLVQKCVTYYANSGLYSLFPFADVEALQFLVTSDVLNYPETSRAANRACLAAFTANITQMHRHDPMFRDADPDAYAHAAISLVPGIITEPPDTRTVEAIMMIAVFICPLGQPQYAEMLLGIAIQALYNLGAHRIRPSAELSTRPQQSNHLRALFWLAYGMDREFSSRKAQPPLINDADCDLHLPPAYALRSSAKHFYFKPLSSKELLYPTDLRLVLIKGRIYRLLYSAQSQGYSETQRLQYIRELDHELSDIKSKYPVEYRPDAFATEDAPDYLFHDLSIRGVSVHLEYYYCLGKIHGAGLTSSQSFPLKYRSPLPSSEEICYEAARSTLIYINRVKHYINYHTFWIHAQFVLTAVLTLFHFLILLPTKETFARDIQIIEEIARIFEPSRQTDEDGNFFPPFHFTHAFIMKLVSLAETAHTKAIAATDDR